MLKQLELINCFVHKRLTVNFQDGMTAIVGKNGKGKSLILEMVQYALWGSVALRGIADDYKGLQVTLTFEVKGIEYSVRRSGSTVRLISGDADLASGTKAVNAYIQNTIFGYSYDVFTMANAINQGKVEELGNMLPTARKRLVDKTIGLDRLDGVSDWISSLTKELRANITASEKYLLPPVEPGVVGTHTAGALSEALGLLQLQLNTYKVLVERAAVALVAPEPVAGSLPELEATQRSRQAALVQQSTIQRALAGFPALGEKPVPHPQAEILEELKKATQAFKDDTAQLDSAQEMLEKMPEAPYTQEQIDEGEARFKARQRWCEKQAFLESRIPHTCPKCDHHWHEEDPRLAEYSDVPDGPPPIQEGMLHGKPLETAKALLANAPVRKGLVDAIALLQERLKKLANHTDTIRAIEASVVAQAVYQERLLQQGRKEELQKELEAIVVPTDVSAQITALTQYMKDMEAYREAVMKRDSALEALKLYPTDLEEQVEKASAEWLARRDYETALAQYLKAKEGYDKLLAEVQRDREALAQWELCKQAVATLRQRVKGFLLPSLSKVASHLLQTMTAGDLNQVTVSDDFDIQVDGQRLETLSGAGKSVANLALRIGLGQVLTNKTFSVLMLDEVDASCDDDRAEAIATSIQRLTGQIKQVIQVSHKQGLTADNRIQL